MPTRIIKKPKVIELQPPKDAAGNAPPKEMDFTEFVRDFLLNQEVWGRDFKHVRMAVAIDRALEANDEEVRLAEEDWKTLKGCIESPKNGLGIAPWALRQMLPFMEAIVEASEEG